MPEDTFTNRVISFFKNVPQYFALAGHSQMSLACLVFGIVIGVFAVRRVNNFREVRFSLIPIVLCAACIYVLTHSERSALGGLVFDKEYGLPFILYGFFFGMISHTLFRLFRIAKREREFSTLRTCFTFLIFPFYLPLLAIFGRDQPTGDDDKKSQRFSALASCAGVVVVFAAAFCLAPHYSKGRINAVIANGNDVRHLTPIHKEY